MSEQNCSCPGCTSADAGTLAVAFGVPVLDAPDEPPSESEPPQPAAASAAAVRTAASATNRRCRGARRPSLVSDIPASSSPEPSGNAATLANTYWQSQASVLWPASVVAAQHVLATASAGTLPRDDHRRTSDRARCRGGRGRLAHDGLARPQRQ